MSKHVLYFSERCRYSQAFLEELVRTPYKNEFVLVCVDPSPNRPPLPKWLKSVPAMVPVGASSPLVGPGPVNNWLFERRLGGPTTVEDAARKTAERNAPLAQPVYSPDIAPRPTVATPMTKADHAKAVSAPPVQTAGEINPYHPAEMGSTKMSDSYSFLGAAESTSDKMYNPIVRNFESLVAVPHMGGASAAPAAPAQKRTAKEQAQVDAMERYLAARDADIPSPAQRR